MVAKPWQIDVMAAQDAALAEAIRSVGMERAQPPSLKGFRSELREGRSAGRCSVPEEDRGPDRGMSSEIEHDHVPLDARMAPASIRSLDRRTGTDRVGQARTGWPR